jgi:hypothetical protein
MFDPLPQSPLWIDTDAHGRVQDVAPEAAKLLGLSARGHECGAAHPNSRLDAKARIGHQLFQPMFRDGPRKEH